MLRTPAFVPAERTDAARQVDVGVVDPWVETWDGFHPVHHRLLEPTQLQRFARFLHLVEAGGKFLVAHWWTSNAQNR